jgi:hypothetical protein
VRESFSLTLRHTPTQKEGDGENQNSDEKTREKRTDLEGKKF